MLHILTLNWNGKDRLEKLYPSLIKCVNGIDFQWSIKDNDSKDGSKELIESWNDPNIKLFKYPHNRDSFSAGCNFLFNEIKSNPEDLILLLNNDVIFNDLNSLKKMISVINKDSDIGVVGAKLLYTDTNRIQHGGVVFDKSYGLPMHFRLNEVDDKHAKKNREFQVVTGAVWLTKSKYYENICCTNKSGLNGLDEGYVWCFDDVSACLSIKYDMGKKIIYCGETNVYHEESASLKKNPANRLFMNSNILRLKNQWENKIKIDRDMYMSNNNYNVYEAKK